MIGKIEISRELAETLVWLHETDQYMDIDIAKLRAILAAPVVERQEPVAYRRFDGEGNFGYWDDEDGKGGSIHFPIEPLYTSPPAPVAVQERHEFEKWIVKDWPLAPLRYVRDALPEDDPLHGTYCDEYLQRAWFGWQARACLDKVKELNQ